MKDIRKLIDGMSANMNGTEIYNPLEFAINKFLKEGQEKLEQQPQVKKEGIMGPVREKYK